MQTSKKKVLLCIVDTHNMEQTAHQIVIIKRRPILHRSYSSGPICCERKGWPWKTATVPPTSRSFPATPSNERCDGTIAHGLSFFPSKSSFSFDVFKYKVSVQFRVRFKISVKKVSESITRMSQDTKCTQMKTEKGMHTHRQTDTHTLSLSLSYYLITSVI